MMVAYDELGMIGEGEVGRTILSCSNVSRHWHGMPGENHNNPLLGFSRLPIRVYDLVHVQ